MKKTFTDEQIVGILRGFEPSGKTIKEYCREKDVSEGTFYKWRSRFGMMEAWEVKEYRQLQQENARLKLLLAERDLEIDVMKEVIAKKWYAVRLVGKLSNSSRRSKSASGAAALWSD